MVAHNVSEQLDFFSPFRRVLVRRIDLKCLLQARDGLLVLANRAVRETEVDPRVQAVAIDLDGGLEALHGILVIAQVTEGSALVVPNNSVLKQAINMRSKCRPRNGFKYLGVQNQRIGETIHRVFDVSKLHLGQT